MIVLKLTPLPEASSTLEGVLAKLRCATRCIRDIMPNGKAELACDIELRLVFAVERDVERLLSRARLKHTPL